MTPDDLDTNLAQDGLEVLGISHSNLPDGHRSLALVGPGPDFWNMFQAAPEFLDNAADPLDRWSRRVLNRQARALGATAYFPFGGPPYHPFQTWASTTGRIWSSPVAFLVHNRHGLFVSFRGALAFAGELARMPGASKPCETCAQPCATACPVAALTPQGYDVAACKAFLDTPAGQDCRNKGCLVRRACPVGATLRDPAQSAFHMAAFHPETSE